MRINFKNLEKIEEDHHNLFHEFTNYFYSVHPFDDMVSIVFDDTQQDSLGKTGSYNPFSNEIVLHINKRHIKDILRSLSHELYHHHQNCQGMFKNLDTSPGYAQRDKRMREIEKGAYLQGNLAFRDWEDERKNGTMNLTESVIRARQTELFREIIKG